MTYIYINKKRLVAEESDTILAVARRNDIEIPTLCHHEALEDVGACRLCTVEITHENWNGWKRLVTSCLYPAEDGLEVFTNSKPVSRLRQTVLDLLLARCPESDVIRKMAEEHGEVTEYKQFEDGSKCIMCYLCVRVCAVQGCNAISAVNRGTFKEIAPPFHGPCDLCIGCGSCAEICPTGHIQMEDTSTARKIWGREFKFVLCDVCGKPTVTEEHLDYTVKNCELPEDYYTTCAACKQRNLAKHFSKIVGHSTGRRENG